MQILIRKPTKGQRIRSEEMSITARVVDVFFYGDITTNYTTRMIVDLQREVAPALGENWRDLIFEALVKVTYAKKKSEYKKGELVRINWDEFQRCKIVDK